MKKDIIVTVMVTFYNQKKYIKECLESILSQNVEFEYEILCGDDGSSDGTYEELLKWKKHYPNKISVYRMYRELGVKYEPIVRVSNNRVFLLSKANGKYITFLDGDDYYLDKDKLNKQVNLLEDNPTCVGCGHPIDVIWEDEPNKKGKQLGKVSNKPIIIGKKVYWKYIWFHADTFLFRNIFMNEIELIDSDFFDDNIITCYHLQYGDIIYLPDSMVAYRQIGESSWNSRTDLQRAFVNMHVYDVSVKILENMRWECFIKCYSAWKELYKNRKHDIKLDSYIGNICDISFVRDTLKYNNENFVFKVKYEIKYSVLMHIEIFIKIFRKFRFLLYKKVVVN